MKTSYIIAGVVVIILIIGGVLWYSSYSKESPNEYQPYQSNTAVQPGTEPSQTAPAQSNTGASNQPSAPAPQPSAPAHTSVSIANFAFSPATITIKKGDTVVWTNTDSVSHTVTGDAFGSQTLAQGDTYSHTFTTAGTFSYHCSIHPHMRGTVIVQ